MITEYVRGAMRQAKYELLPEDNVFYGEIPGFDGVYATGSTLEACREELEDVLEEWILLRISQGLQAPVVDGIDLTIRETA